jgi:SET domain-containing protein
MKPEVRVGRSRTGLGLYAVNDIPKDAKIIEYTGRLIRNEVADTLWNRYLYTVNSRWTVDGSSRRNIARYANHSCRPNAYSDTKGKRIYIYARRKIKAGEEIVYDYGKDYFDAFFGDDGCRCLKCKPGRKRK